MLKRTQVNLTEQQDHLLLDESRKLGIPKSELLRRMVDEHFNSRVPAQQRLENLKAASGLWSDRDDIGDSVEYTKRLRTPLKSLK